MNIRSVPSPYLLRTWATLEPNTSNVGISSNRPSTANRLDNRHPARPNETTLSEGSRNVHSHATTKRNLSRSQSACAGWVMALTMPSEVQSTANTQQKAAQTLSTTLLLLVSPPTAAACSGL